jgi:hypothetical protein
VTRAMLNPSRKVPEDVTVCPAFQWMLAASGEV